MESKATRRNRLIGRICELIERGEGATFSAGGNMIKINRVWGKNVYDNEGTEIFINNKKSTWNDIDFKVLEEIVEIINDCNLGITF